jgi:hypothetical protein
MAEDQAIPQTTTEGNQTQDADGELKAMNAIVEALKPLSDPQRRRALEYVAGRFGVLPVQPPTQRQVAQVATDMPGPNLPTGYVQDIRSLKDVKNPKSANEMAALVAYYVSELAPAAESKQINRADIERYFKTAGFRLPADASFTLVNAKNAGYLDTAGGGNYTLNPVGYNLVVHRMGIEQTKKKARSPKKATHKISKKTAKKASHPAKQ